METFLFLYEKCRLCLEQPGAINIFGSETIHLSEDINLCAGVRVHPKDNLPQNLCNECFEIIQKAKKLRTQALKNNNHLRSLFVVDDAHETCNVTQHSEEHDITSSCSTKDTTEQSTSEIQQTGNGASGISVRKDLFVLTPTVTSSSKSLPESTEVVDDAHLCKKIRIDDNTVLFECPVCFKTYDGWKKLYLHQRHHNKTIVCPIEACGKKFSAKGDLAKHIRIHTGEKPYKCNECDRSFTQRGTLKCHKERVHCILASQ